MRQRQRLLATAQVGPLGVDARHHPLIFVVDYAMDGDVVVVRTHPGRPTPTGRD